ncbi:MAG: hypothetical protein Q8P01_04460 [bacterium]|nr:hypothetical protein [bacterium]
MNPKDYYYNQFASDLKELMEKVNVIGNHAYDFVEPFSGGRYGFMIVELFKSSKQDPLEHISKANLGYFLSALAGTILMDQVMFTHFKEDYEKFRTITLYPKITWSPGWCANVKPWQLFEHRIALTRGLQNPEKINHFLEFMKFFVEDLREFFGKNQFQKAGWESAKSAMLNDNDIVSNKYGEGDYGTVFKKILEKS